MPPTIPLKNAAPGELRRALPDNATTAADFRTIRDKPRSRPSRALPGGGPPDRAWEGPLLNGPHITGAELRTRARVRARDWLAMALASLAITWCGAGLDRRIPAWGRNVDQGGGMQRRGFLRHAGEAKR